MTFLEQKNSQIRYPQNQLPAFKSPLYPQPNLPHTHTHQHNLPIPIHKSRRHQIRIRQQSSSQIRSCSLQLLIRYRPTSSHFCHKGPYEHPIREQRHALLPILYSDDHLLFTESSDSMESELALAPILCDLNQKTGQIGCVFFGTEGFFFVGRP